MSRRLRKEDDLSCGEENLPGCFVEGYKTELIADRVWCSRSQLELATMEYIGWFNHQRLHESLGDIPPVEYEQLYLAPRR